MDIFSKIKLVFFDFDGVFTDNKVLTDQNGIESVCCWRSDGIGLSRLKDVNVIAVIISTETNKVVSSRANKLNIKCFQGVEDKAVILKKIAEKYSISLNQAIFVGNDVNDISAFKIVGLPIAVLDSYPEILPYVKFITNRSGGNGAVREVCDLIYNSKIKLSE